MRKCVSIFLFLLSFCIGNAQQKQLIDSLVYERLNDMSLVFKTENTLVEDSIQKIDFYEFDSVFISTTQVQDDFIEQIINEHESKLSLIKQDIGLKLRGNYTENLNPGIGETDDYLVYERRFYAGVDWDILNNGLVERESKKQLERNNKTIDVLSNQMRFRKKHYQANRYIVMYLFNREKVQILENRKRIVDKKAALARELYFLKYYTREQLLDILAAQSEIVSMYKVYADYNNQMELAIDSIDFPEGGLPVFDIDLAKAVELSMSDDNDSIFQLRLQNIDIQSKAINNINLAAFARYNYYMTPSERNRDFVSVGLNFSMPVPLKAASAKSYAKAKSERLRIDNSLDDSNIEIELLNLFYQFRYRQKQYYTFIEKRRKNLERLRRYRAMMKLDTYEFSPFKAIDIIDELYQIQIEMLDLRQLMYFDALQMYYKLPSGKFTDFLKPVDIEELFKINTRSNIAIYIWSKSFDDYSIDFIDEYMRYNNVATAIVSLRNDFHYKTKTLQLINKINEVGVRAELMLGTNNLINEQDVSAYLENITNGVDFSKVEAIHLDVEPHTFDDWKTKKTEYLDKYVALLTKTKEFCSNTNCKLSVSIPVFYPEKYLELIYQIADKVYIMAYEQITVERTVRKVQEEIKIDKSKTNIAFRTKDFENRLFMEQFIEQVQKETQIYNITIHDFNTLVELDKKSLGKEEIKK